MKVLRLDQLGHFSIIDVEKITYNTFKCTVPWCYHHNKYNPKVHSESVGKIGDSIYTLFYVTDHDHTRDCTVPYHIWFKQLFARIPDVGWYRDILILAKKDQSDCDQHDIHSIGKHLIDMRRKYGVQSNTCTIC